MVLFTLLIPAAVGCAGTAPDAETPAPPSVGDVPAASPSVEDAPASPPAMADIPQPPAEVADSREQWTAGIVDAERDVSGVATLTAVRVARNEGFDRIVIEFAGGAIPSYHLEYVDSPVRQCGSGEPVEIPGEGWLLIRLEPARAHDDQGEVTITNRVITADLPVVRELRIICDFEAQVEWVAGVSRPDPYRVLELADPARLVVDLQH